MYDVVCSFRTLAAIIVAYAAIKLVLAMVGFLGFGPNGEVGGSLAAWIMSFHSGLVSAPGGIVATLQSIGFGADALGFVTNVFVRAARAVGYIAGYIAAAFA